VDRVRSAAESESLTVDARRHDLDDGLPDGAWSLVVVTYFLERNLWTALRDAVEPHGMLLFETWSVAHAERTGFPRKYCLEPGELERIFAGWEVLASREARDADRDVAGILVRKPSRGV
jgi:tellurite methyltransferase